MFVATLAPGSPAARDCALTVGDRLLAVSMLPKNLFNYMTRDDAHLMPLLLGIEVGL